MSSVPEPPATAEPALVMPEDIEGTYESSLYGTLVIARGDEGGTADGEFTLSIGSVAYPGILRHWDGDTWQAVWNNPDDVPDLFTIIVEGDGSVSGVEGEKMGFFRKIHF